MFLSGMATRVVVPAVALPDSIMLVQGAYAYNIEPAWPKSLRFPSHGCYYISGLAANA
jgi:hypothetical protein